MKFLRANPNLLLKVVPTTLAVDEQGIETLNNNMNKDLNPVQKEIRLKSAVKRKRINKSKLIYEI